MITIASGLERRDKRILLWFGYLTVIIAAAQTPLGLLQKPLSPDINAETPAICKPSMKRRNGFALHKYSGKRKHIQH
jgi:hypothetical protein